MYCSNNMQRVQITTSTSLLSPISNCVNLPAISYLVSPQCPIENIKHPGENILSTINTKFKHTLPTCGNFILCHVATRN